MSPIALNLTPARVGFCFSRTMARTLESHRSWALCAAVFLLLAAAFLALSAVDTRLFNGVSVWSKPFKFALSLSVYFATLACFAPLLPAGYFATLRGKVLTWLPIACAAFEIVYIALQAALGEASHFNETTTLHSAMYSLMGVGAVTLVAMCVWMGVSILRHRGVSDPYVVAVVAGLTMTFLLGGMFGGYMSSQPSHWVGGVVSDANGLWFFHWARAGGDLRVPHFFGMHAMQILPIMALPMAGRQSRSALICVLLITTTYAAFTICTFLQAIVGKPFIG